MDITIIPSYLTQMAYYTLLWQNLYIAIQVLTSVDLWKAFYDLLLAEGFTH